MKNHTAAKPIFYTYVDMPIGKMLLVAQGATLTGTYVVGQKGFPTMEPHWQQNDEVACFQSLKQQLSHYFNGTLTQFSVDYALEGTPLQKETWQQLSALSYGQPISYKALAQRTSFPHAVRAVATAVGANPLLIILPCHRVLRSNGQLGGYAAGLSVKKQLLNLEQGSKYQLA
ncbi:MAG: methylated-DNA--[protein]-cysteine S-methyltransferase [Roseivirga sp.]